MNARQGNPMYPAGGYQTTKGDCKLVDWYRKLI